MTYVACLDSGEGTQDANIYTRYYNGDENEDLVYTFLIDLYTKIMATGLPTFPEFDFRDQTDLAARWKKYLKSFKNLMTDESRKRALLLHYIGKEVNNLFDTLTDKGKDTDLKNACEALTRYFTPKKNVSFEIFKFRNLKQEPNETIYELHTRLQMASKYCEFGENSRAKISKATYQTTHNYSSFKTVFSLRICMASLYGK